MNKASVVVQTRGIDTKIKERAELVAQMQGFNSLQDAIRLFIAQLANGQIRAGFGYAEENWKLTPEMIKIYEKDYEEYQKSAREEFRNAEDMVAALMAD